MERIRATAFDAWKERSDRKPLVVRGARQVGKTWLVREWGRTRFERVVEANLERHPQIRTCFTDNDPRATLGRLAAVLGAPVSTDGSTLLFLDEIQAAPEVLSKLRWFAEELPELPLVAAGSLLDFALLDPSFSMPVGRITYLHLEPLGFLEFCRAVGDAPLVEWLRSGVSLDTIESGEALPSAVHEKCLHRFREWLLVGGMPAAVETWTRGRNLAEVSAVHRDLLATLRDDFAKYSSAVHHRRLTAVLDSVPLQLGQKFRYSAVDPGERAEPLRRAVDLLSLARVTYRVVASSARGVPLGAGVNERTFKLLHLDVGLSTTALGLTPRELEAAADIDLVNRGAVAEQAVGQLLRLNVPPNAEPRLFWWRRDQPGSSAELDYVQAHGPRIVPVEVKAGAGGSLKSLHIFVSERGLPWALRINSAPPLVTALDVATQTGERASYRLLSIPAYLVELLPRLLDEMEDRGAGRTAT